jgi:hypothetical protein
MKALVTKSGQSVVESLLSTLVASYHEGKKALQLGVFLAKISI